MIGRLYGLLGPLGGEGMGVGLLHDPEYKEQDVDVEAGVYVKHRVEAQAPLRCYQLPEVTVASEVHHGAFNRIGEAYTDLLRWIEANHYHPGGPTRELFLHVNQKPVSRDNSSNVTEIQVPVRKRVVMSIVGLNPGSTIGRKPNYGIDSPGIVFGEVAIGTTAPVCAIFAPRLFGHNLRWLEIAIAV